MVGVGFSCDYRAKPILLKRIVSCLASMPRSCSKSLTFRGGRGKRTYIITARQIMSGLVLEFRNGVCFVVCPRDETALPLAGRFLLTLPPKAICWRTVARRISGHRRGKSLGLAGPKASGRRYTLRCLAQPAISSLNWRHARSTPKTFPTSPQRSATATTTAPRQAASDWRSRYRSKSSAPGEVPAHRGN